MALAIRPFGGSDEWLVGRMLWEQERTFDGKLFFCGQVFIVFELNPGVFGIHRR